MLDGDFRCSDTTPLYVGNCDALYGGCSDDDCRAVCDENKSCTFYASWYSGHCEVYADCPTTSADGSLQIRLWKTSDTQGNTTCNVLNLENHNLISCVDGIFDLILILFICIQMKNPIH